MAMIPAVQRNKRTGELSVSNSKRHFQPFWLKPDNDTDGVLSLTAAAGSTATSPVTVSHLGPQYIKAFTANSDRFEAFGDYGALIEILDSGTNKNLQNNAIHMNTIFGTPNYPLVLPEFYYLDAQRSFSVSMSNIFAYAQDIRLMFGGTRIYPTTAESNFINKKITELEQQSIGTLPYFLTTTETVTLAGDATDVFTLPADADSYIEIFKAAAVGYDNDNQAPNMDGTCTVEIRDAEHGRKLHSGNLEFNNFFGTGEQPLIFPESLLVLPRQRMHIEVTNTTPNSHEATFYFTFIGRKLYVK